jgi:hypothetical protein
VDGRGGLGTLGKGLLHCDGVEAEATTDPQARDAACRCLRLQPVTRQLENQGQLPEVKKIFRVVHVPYLQSLEVW